MDPQLNLASQRAALARTARKAKTDPTAAADLEQARTEYATAKLEDYIRRVVDQAPPLTVEQRERIASVLADGAA